MIFCKKLLKGKFCTIFEKGYNGFLQETFKTMRKVKLYIAASFDGKIARPDGAIDWLPSPTAEDYGYDPFYNSIDTIVMGYATYEVCLSFDGKWPYNGKKSYVFTRSATKPILEVAERVTESPADFVRKLKEQEGGDIWLLGGGQINTLLHDAGLIDEYIIAYIPVLLGEGIELFPDIKKQVNLSITQHKVYDSGIAMFYFSQKKE